MASYSPSACCTTGFKHDGAPTGQKIQIAERWDAYYAKPPVDKEHKNMAILYLPDVVGIWQNSQLMADQFAAHGYHTLVVDTFDGDAIPLNRPEGFDMKKWMLAGSDGKHPHTPESVDPIIVDAIKFLREDHGIKRIGAVGYCFGGKYVIRHYKSGIDVGFVAHPSGVQEEELASIAGPLSVAAAETDPLFPAEKRHASEKILADRGLPYQITLYSGVAHGFAVREDVSKRNLLFAKEQAFSQAVCWFNEYLM